MHNKKGAVEAVFGAGKDILVVGFDATDDAIAAILEGREVPGAHIVENVSLQIK